MIRFIYGYNLLLEPQLAKQMFQDRAAQFADRLGWAVDVNEHGLERDIYDTLNPLYVVVTDDRGAHLGSMRFLPTTGRTMLNEHFKHLYSGPPIASPLVWECTRFCIAPGASVRVSIQLLAAGAALMRAFCLQQLAAVFDEKMLRVYRRSGASPEILGCGLYEGNQIGVGLWHYSREQYLQLLRASQIDPIEMELFLANSDICRDSLLAA
ncbi:acyl-homoserine-lactone synthase [Yoonia sp. 2307UL14-13]|uniref:acyl-homoserine-lactone synthase n=1 Tax=Yoonia sp. 2307UL14-13 TaxID=3126506 RepID=UPI0030B2E5D1